MSSSELVKEITDAAKRGTEETLPVSSKDRYIKTYNAFIDWKEKRGNPENCDTVLMAYFVGLSDEGKKPTSLWAYYSMIKSMIRLKEKLDISKYFDLTAFLKRKSEGYEPTKSLIFEDYEMQRFLVKADDTLCLDVKVVSILGMFGAMRGGELAKLAFKDVSEQGNLYIVWVRNTKNKMNRYFTITGPCCAVVKKYIELRPSNPETERFFMNYQKGRCIHQVVGKQKFTQMPRRIAQFLQLPDAEKYTGHSFRRSGASMHANAGVGIDAVKNIGGWKSAKVAEGYVVNSLSYKKRTSNTLPSLLSEESVSTTIDTTKTPQMIIAKDNAPSGALKTRRIEATCTTVSSISTQESVSYEVEKSEQVEKTSEHCVSSQGYSESTGDGITDTELMSFDVIEKSKEVEHTSELCVSSQGFVKTAEDDITDTELTAVADEQSSTALDIVRRHFSFSNCTVTINFKN